ncbi:YkgJ family cysteine cluster protein [Candidatus Pyrohabitans sp.]
MKHITLDFTAIRHGFKCERCGRCCFGSSRKIGIRLFFQEVSAIQRFLGGMEKERFEEFAWDYLTLTGMSELIGDADFVEEFRSTLTDFFFSVGRSFDSSNYFVEYYILKTFQDSGRCIFFNPLSMECFIHQAKPMTCRLYPYYANIDIPAKRIDFRQHGGECPGLVEEEEGELLLLGKEGLNLVEVIRDHYLTLASLLESDGDATKLREIFIENLRYVEVTPEKARQEFEKMTSHKKVVSLRDYFLENGLINATKNYRNSLL